MHPQQRNTSPRQPARQRGLTLIELMVAMVIGLFLIGGVIGVFIANQQTSTAKQDLDRAQENFRFGSHTLMRVMRQGTDIQFDDATQQLIVEIGNGAGAHDCVGRVSGDDPDFSTENAFSVNADGELICTDDAATEHVLMSEVDELTTLFAVDGIDPSNCAAVIAPTDQDGLLANDEFVDNDCVDDSQCQDIAGVTGSCWSQVRAARATLTLTDGQELPFTGTMRPMVVASLGGGGAAGNTPPTEDPPSEDTPSEDTPSEDTPSEDTPSEDTSGNTTPPTTFSCSCSHNTKSEKWSVKNGSDSRCTAACCEENDDGSGLVESNKRPFSISVSSC